MVKKIGSFVILSFVVIGALNFHALNAKAFKDITTTVTTKPLGEIPGKIFSTVVSHQWKFTHS